MLQVHPITWRRFGFAVAMIFTSHLARAEPSSSTAVALLDSLARAPVGPSRTAMFYRLMEKLDRGEVTLTTPEQSARLARVMSKIMISETEGVMPWQAAAMMARYPHPAATPALLAVAKRPRKSVLARMSALQALVSLHEPRVFPLLVDDVDRLPANGSSSSIHLLAELGIHEASRPYAAS